MQLSQPSAALVTHCHFGLKFPIPISIRVYSNLDGGRIYLDRAYRGPSRVTIQLPYGTRGMITCQMFGYAAGAVAIAFDGKMESIACPMVRLGGCVEDIATSARMRDQCRSRDGGLP